nr:hypothetical protein CFP56_11460 [Quercus suber]
MEMVPGRWLGLPGTVSLDRYDHIKKHLARRSCAAPVEPQVQYMSSITLFILPRIPNSDWEERELVLVWTEFRFSCGHRVAVRTVIHAGMLRRMDMRACAKCPPE